MSVAQLTLPKQQLEQIGLHQPNLHYQLSVNELVQDSLRLGEGSLNDTGALMINTGKFTGRSPKDKFIVRDRFTSCHVNWNDFNIAIEPHYFLKVKETILAHLNELEEVWVQDGMACADEHYRVNIRVITEKPWIAHFAHNMFIRPNEDQLKLFYPDWTILSAPNLQLDPSIHGTRQSNAALISFEHKTVLIAGTGYTGETKKGIFTILNFILPLEHQVLSMHCSANIGKNGDTALFFGLSGTGKTTLSADPNRFLIGDDEHGWSKRGIFNFEGGCYAKCIDLNEEKEPEIFQAIRSGALVENVVCFKDTNAIDFSNKSITENTRVSYPLDFISNAVHPSEGGHPEHIFFLTCDAYGVLPPISKLTPEQAMYQFISGYTAKVAGTEAGVTEPTATFSACFGAPFLPLHPGKYAELLGEKLKKHEAKVWLINTGWTGGAYGTGSRMKLNYTRAMITAALEGKLDQVSYETDAVFGFDVPQSCPDVPSHLLNPRATWSNVEAYDEAAKALAKRFVTNFEKFASGVAEAIVAAGPKL